jgi:hypothetical protein
MGLGTRASGFGLATVVAGAIAACGGSSPPPKPVAPPPPVKPTRVPVDDSEVEEGVTIVHARGHMEQAAVEAGLAPHTGELADCYTKQVGRRRWLGGHVKIHWDIAKDGTITKVVLASESDLGAWPIEKCLLEIARAASFDKPVGGDADFDIPLDFTAKGAILPWDEDMGLKAVGKQLAKLDPCGKAQAAPDEVVVTLYVGPHGKPLSVGFSSDKFEIKDDWAQCAEKAALAWKLTDPRGTIAKMAIRYHAR